ncbi:thiamine pyrophosphate-binding protein [Streptomyces xinghaiensis]|uniref:thiamine pyrophosphate-binding protein n=1 Tax=Streptomyces xinghaiensis TaxID=1038928 RepID=UPI00344029C2
MSAPAASTVHDTHEALVRHGFGPYFATPCGILAPLLDRLEAEPGYHVVTREDNAIGQAAGAALAGAAPVALMQNSGFGQSVNALASLVVPYEIPMLLIVSLRGVDPDPTPENLGMGRFTATALDTLGIPHRVLDPGTAAERVGWARRVLREPRSAAALLVRPDTFGWKA